MAEYIDDPAKRLNDLLDLQEARVADIFRTAVASLKDEINIDELADLIEQGRVNDALDKLVHVAEQLGSASTVAFLTSGQSTADFLLAAGVGRVAFNHVNVEAVAQMQANRLELVREFTDEQRRATNLAIVAGVESGINPRAQARNFRDSIGLTERQWQAVANYKSALERVGTDPSAQTDALNRALRDKRGDASIHAAVRDNRPMTPERIDWLHGRYIERYIKYRSEVIGRTEAMRAVNQGNEEAYRQAIEAGTIDAADLERTWLTRLDDRERHTHFLLNRQKRGWGEPWQTVNGIIRYPGDPEAAAEETIQCRCALATRIRKR